MSVPAGQVLALSVVLFAIGVVGVLARRNVFVMLLSVELMLNAAMLGLVGSAVRGGVGIAGAASEAGGPAGVGGEWFAILVALVAIGQLIVVLAVVAAWLRHRDSLDVDDASALRW